MLTFKFYFVILDDIGCERKSLKYFRFNCLKKIIKKV